jgi:hypothetical protein
MSRAVRPSTSTTSGALRGAVVIRIVSLPSSTIERSGDPCAASGVSTIASSAGETAGPPASTL